MPFRLEASKKIAWRPKSCLATAENFLHLPGTGLDPETGWKSWNMDETNRFCWNWGFSTLLSGFLKVCWTWTKLDSFNNISGGLTVDSFSMSPWTKWWFSRGSIKTLSSDASFVDGLALNGWNLGKNGAELKWLICGVWCQILRIIISFVKMATKGETINEFHDFIWFQSIPIKINSINSLFKQKTARCMSTFLGDLWGTSTAAEWLPQWPAPHGSRVPGWSGTSHQRGSPDRSPRPAWALVFVEVFLWFLGVHLVNQFLGVIDVL